MLGVMAASVAMVFVSLGGLGATGYYLFTTKPNGDHAAVTGTTRATQHTTTQSPTIQKVDIGSPPLPPRVWKLDKFDLRPVTGTVPTITPPTLTADLTTIDLTPFGGRVGAITVGGGGRYIVMHFPDKGMLNVFDASEGRLLGGIETDKGDVKLAAGLSWIITAPVSPTGGSFRAYSLPTLAHRYDSSVELFGGVGAMAMGNRTDGPLLVTNPFGDVVLLDIGATGLKEIEGARKKPGILPNYLRATPDGTAFLSYVMSFDPPISRDVKVLTETSRDWQVATLDAAVTTPAADGNFGMVQKRLMLGNSHPLGTYLQRAFWRRHCADVTWPPDQFLENRVNPSISTQ